jgi:hypothetical protein
VCALPRLGTLPADHFVYDVSTHWQQQQQAQQGQRQPAMQVAIIIIINILNPASVQPQAEYL